MRTLFWVILIAMGAVLVGVSAGCDQNMLPDLAREHFVRIVKYDRIDGDTVMVFEIKTTHQCYMSVHDGGTVVVPASECQ